MSDLNLEFSAFYQQISLSGSQIKMMRDLRQSLHTCIRRYFQDRLNLRPPTFFGRGRQAIGTAISPAYEEIFMEEGALLQHLHRDAIDGWPDPEIVHLLMLNASQDHTPEPPIDKKHSVCVRYPGWFRIEIAILAPGPDSNLLAINDARGWQPDIQERLATWFKNQIKHQGLQLLRIASYLHAWADFHPNQLEGFAWMLPLDILAARYFQADIERDDKSLARTAAAIAEAAPSDFQWSSPIDGENTLPWLISQQESQQFLQSLGALAEKSRLATMTKDKTHASAIWRSLLGGRFPGAGAILRKFNGGVKGLQLGRRYSNH